MDGVQTEALAVPPAITTDRPVWQRPEITEVEINDVTGCCYALGGNDGTPTITSIS